MTKIIKNLAIMVGVLVLSTAIYFLVSENQQLREGVFNRSLRLLGEQLITLLPEENDRQLVAEKWQGIISKANEGEIPPEQVERLAVGILNASNLDRDFTVNDAELILNLALPDNSTDRTFIMHVPPQAPVPPTEKSFEVIQKKRTVVYKKKLEEMGQKLENVLLFNKKIKDSFGENPDNQKIFTQHLRYSLNDGIRLRADLDLKYQMDRKTWEGCSEQLKKLEQDHIVDWQTNFAEALAQEQEKIRLQLDSLRTTIEIHGINVELAEQKRLQTLEALEKLQHWQVMDPKMVEKVVYEMHPKVEVKAKAN
jgi:hypothetical protein